MQNVDFFRLCENFTFEVQKTFFSIQNIKNVSLLLFCSKKKNLSEKGRFFDKNHGLTPLQNVDSLEFYRSLFFALKSILFYAEHQKMFLSGFFAHFYGFFCSKKTYGKKGRFFDKNHKLTPLKNVDFFRLCENFTFEVQKTFFSIQNIKRMFLSCFFAQKKKLIRRRSIFSPKAWTNPFAKCRFFSVF